MLDVVALGELLIDFATLETDKDGYPTMAASPASRNMRKCFPVYKTISGVTNRSHR